MSFALFENQRQVARVMHHKYLLKYIWSVRLHTQRTQTNCMFDKSINLVKFFIGQ